LRTELYFDVKESKTLQKQYVSYYESFLKSSVVTNILIWE